MKNEFFYNNLQTFSSKLEPNSIAAVFSGNAPIKSGDEFYPFTPDRNFYYLTGIDREGIILLICKTQKETTQTLYIKRDNGYLAKWVGAELTEQEAYECSGINDIKFIDQFNSDFAEMVFKNNLQHIYLD